MIRTLDQFLAWLLILLGCVHNFIAAPMTYSNLSTQALWFVSAGLALWYAGFINLLRARLHNGSPLVAGLSLLTNATLLAFVITYATASGSWTAPESLFLVGVVAVLTLTAARSLIKRPIGA